ncbi:MAG: hypothetical protein MOGMAGMI_01964 [Candidatus Omnitrophica bacterium]|nr:hypothetical protein [Candidatus Omnitrophota bacterium]
MASLNAGDVSARVHESYVDCGREKNILITKGGAGSICTVTLPDWAKGFRIFPSAEIIFHVSKNDAGADDPAAQATSNAAAIDEGDMSIGGIAKADQWETRLLPTTHEGYRASERFLKLYGAAGSETIDLEIF